MSLSKFKKLHQQDTPLILGNVWDAHSAKSIEQAGFKAIGTSSHAIAFSLGYADGEQIPFEELLFMVKRITKSVKIPVSVDFEAGYSTDPETVAQYVKQLVDVGVVGINLEDGIVKKGKRVLGDSQHLVDKITAIKAISDVFINARTDTYTTKQENALSEAIRRAHLYQEAGADGIFVPLIETKADITAFVKEVKLPLNIFITPKVPSLTTSVSIGVKRISHGAKIYDWLMEKAEKEWTKLEQTAKLPK